MALTEAQLELRRTGTGGSEIPSLVGLNPWAGPADVYAEKVLGARKEASLRMELGNLGEEPIAQLYKKHTGHQLLESTTLKHPRKERALATPDRLVFLNPPEDVKRWTLEEADGLLQIKWTSMRLRQEWGTPGTDEVPAWVNVQTQWELDTAGKDRSDVAVLFDRDAFEIYVVERDAELVEGLHEVNDRFWVDHVLAKRPPPPDASDRYAEFLAKLHPQEKSEELVLAPPDIEEVARRLRELERRAKLLEAGIKLRKNQLRAFIGDGLGVLTPHGKITWKASRPRVKTDWEGLARQLAMLLEQARAQGMNYPRLAEVVKSFTTLEPGGRVLRKSWEK